MQVRAAHAALPTAVTHAYTFLRFVLFCPFSFFSFYFLFLQAGLELAAFLGIFDWPSFFLSFFLGTWLHVTFSLRISPSREEHSLGLEPQPLSPLH